MDLNIIDLIDGHRFDSTIACRGSFGHFDDNLEKPAGWRTRPNAAAQNMLIEQRHKCAVLDTVEVGIALTALAALISASNRFEGLPGSFDQPPLRLERKIHIGHDRTDFGFECSSRYTGIQLPVNATLLRPMLADHVKSELCEVTINSSRGSLTGSIFFKCWSRNHRPRPHISQINVDASVPADKMLRSGAHQDLQLLIGNQISQVSVNCPELMLDSFFARDHEFDLRWDENCHS